MTTRDTLPSAPAPTSVSPTAHQVWTRTRGILLALVLLLVAAVVIAALRSGGQHGRLDPRSADPYGSRAVAEILADHGVTTRVVTTLDQARAAAGPDTTLLVAVPDLLTDDQQSLLRSATAASGGRTVLVAPDSPSVGTLAPGVTAAPAPSFDTTLSPDCSLPAARRAGTADTGGGVRYSTTVHRADACYPSDGLPTLLRIPQTGEGGDTVVLGSPDILYNNRLDQRGNASLALQLLGSRPQLVWYLPSLSDAPAPDTGDRSLVDLLPSGWLWGTLQLFIAAVLAALWRARRLGPLVPEKLPVAIRASETAEGRARLYRKANARDRAAAALRSATRTRLAPLVGVPAAQAHTPEALLPALSARLGDGQSLHDLLFGPPPRDDAALVSLTDRLDALEREVRRS
ncbi:hypothetical protein STXM2123_5621 [Streptomyces sp. F-3]|uniref:DUF4350 domain-containing protein n=1 Tax=Streptomyces sp. F-3 TaxID=1840095 RepID=UPI0007C409CE|nr:DUF4350 domain-containing protein [Streptomyces sp. F-3]GAT84920.1 hypothetical protein STXM2123_5621 [Streptomyces sp. F-3]